MTRVFVGPDLVELETKKTITFPKPLSEWLNENRFEFERTAQVVGESRREYSSVITPVSTINYIDTHGFIAALRRYEKYVDEHFNL